VSSVAVYGGNDGNRYDQELRSMRMGADVLIATPGRLLSHLKVGNLDLSHCSFFVLDEADRMLDMGFVDDIMKIVQQLPKDCQRIMFSATMPKKIRELAVQLLNNPVEVQIAVSRPAEKIHQMAYVCYEPQKLKIIQHIFKNGNLQRVIIFSGKKERVKEVTRKLKSMHINCDQMHSDLSQAERDEAMYRFKAGQTDVLVATDIVARGIDIDDIRLVINYDVPADSEDYVHRIGRTARADRDGEAITFVSDTDIYRFQGIEHFLGKEVEKIPLPEGLGDAPEYVKRPKKANSRKSNGRWHSRGHGKPKAHPKKKV
jgi:superfamily II DNA/RNA helicase